MAGTILPLTLKGSSVTQKMASTAAASITGNFEELQRELQAFNELFGLWTDQRRRALMDDKEAFLRTVSEEQDAVEALRRQYQQLIHQKQKIQEILAAEEQEREEYAKQNQEYTSQRDTLKHKLSLIKKEIDMVEVEIIKETHILEARQRTRETTRNQRLADLHMYREKLGIRVSPMEGNPNHFQVEIDKVDLKEPERVVKFCIDISDMMNLRPFQFQPAIPTEQLQTLIRGQANVFKLIGQIRSFYCQNLS